MRLDVSDARAVADIAAVARTLGDDERPITDQLGPQLRDVLRAEFVSSYRAAPVDETGGWKLEHLQIDGEYPAHFRARLERCLANAPPRGFTLFDVVTPLPTERNRVVRPWLNVSAREAEAMPLMRDCLAPLGLARHDQLRALLCDGPILMAWLGALRRAPFGPRESKILEALVPPIRTRLRLERRLLRADVMERGFAAALDATAAISVLCRRDGHVVFASAAGRARLDTDDRMREMLDAAARGHAVHGVVSTPVRQRGLPEHVLVTFLEERSTSELSRRLALASMRWGLTVRQAEVLALVVRGESNQGIAERLRCRESTVAAHVAAVLRKARVERRAGLVPRLWTLS